MSFQDTCYYLEAVTGDGGNHTAAVWWLSPDIILNGGTDVADPGSPNHVAVRVHGQCPAGIGTDSDPIVDVYVGDPSLVMTPTINTTKITNASGRPFVAGPGAPLSGNVLVPFIWNNGGTAFEGPGHKCLIAQIYPGGETPSTTTFDLPGEMHVAQRNIAVLTCEPSCELVVNSVNPNPRTAEKVTIRAVVDIRPPKHVLEAAKAVTKGISGFRRIRVTDVPQFSIDLSKRVGVRIRNNTGKQSVSGGRLLIPHCEATLTLERTERITFKLSVQMEKVRSGDAYIFHLTHIQKRRVLGGLTVVAIRRPPRK